MIPIKCQVCPYLEQYGKKYDCSLDICKLRYDGKLRKQVYKALESLGEKK